MGWPKFFSWSLENAEGGEAGIDTMAEHYADLRDEASTDKASKLKGPEALQLEATVKAVRLWLYRRAEVGGAYKGGSLYSHLGPRLTAELADVKAQCIEEWGNSADPMPNRWPKSYQDMASAPLKSATGDPQNLKPALKEEATTLQEACTQIRKLPSPARQLMQKFVLDVGDRVDPNSRI